MIGLEYIANLYNYQFKDVAEQLGVSKQVVNGWIKERYKISSKHLPKLSAIFNIPEKYFQKELTDLEKLEIQNIKISNEAIVHETEQIKINKDGEEVKIKGLLFQGVDVNALQINELEQRTILEQQKLSSVVFENGMRNAVEPDYDAITAANDILDLYSLLGKIIDNGNIRVETMREILSASLSYNNTLEKTKQTPFIKKVIKEIVKEEEKKQEEERLYIQNLQNEYNEMMMRDYLDNNN